MNEVLAACRGVVVVYGAGEAAVGALDAVDLTIEAKESLALLGRSGSGKTTLLHVLGGLVEPIVGTVEWQGELLATLDAAPASWLMNIEASGEAGLDPETILGTLIAIAPVIGTARIVSAAANIMKAFELAEELAEDGE